MRSIERADGKRASWQCLGRREPKAKPTVQTGQAQVAREAQWRAWQVSNLRPSA